MGYLLMLLGVPGRVCGATDGSLACADNTACLGCADLIPLSHGARNVMERRRVVDIHFCSVARRKLCSSLELFLKFIQLLSTRKT